MTDAVIAGIARDLALAMMQRARSRTADDAKAVLELQTRLCSAVREEAEQEAADQTPKEP